MTCKSCNGEIADNVKFCPNCGAEVIKEEVVTETVPVPPVMPEQRTTARESVPQQSYVRPQVKIPPANYAPPAEYKPISAWGYIGWNILFSIPVVGWILILIFGLGGTKNVNLKNYARSFLIVFLIVLGIIALAFVLLFILSVVMGASMSSMAMY